MTTPSIAVTFQHFDSGFSSFLNNALNAFLIAWIERMPFHLIISPTWPHIAWSLYFNDFSSASPSPIILEDNDPASPRSSDITLPYTINKNNPLPECLCGLRNLTIGHYTVPMWGFNWHELRNGAEGRARGVDRWFDKKKVCFFFLVAFSFVFFFFLSLTLPHIRL